MQSHDPRRPFVMYSARNGSRIFLPDSRSRHCLLSCHSRKADTRLILLSRDRRDSLSAPPCDTEFASSAPRYGICIPRTSDQCVALSSPVFGVCILCACYFGLWRDSFLFSNSLFSFLLCNSNSSTSGNKSRE